MPRIAILTALALLTIGSGVAVSQGAEEDPLPLCATNPPKDEYWNGHPLALSVPVQGQPDRYFYMPRNDSQPEKDKMGFWREAPAGTNGVAGLQTQDCIWHRPNAPPGEPKFVTLYHKDVFDGLDPL